MYTVYETVGNINFPVGCLSSHPVKNRDPQNHLECIKLGVSMDRSFQFPSMTEPIFLSPRLQPGVFPSPTWSVLLRIIDPESNVDSLGYMTNGLPEVGTWLQGGDVAIYALKTETEGWIRWGSTKARTVYLLLGGWAWIGFWNSNHLPRHELA